VCLIHWFVDAKIYLEVPHSVVFTVNVHPIMQCNFINRYSFSDKPNYMTKHPKNYRPSGNTGQLAEGWVSRLCLIPATCCFDEQWQ